MFHISSFLLFFFSIILFLSRKNFLYFPSLVLSFRSSFLSCTFRLFLPIYKLQSLPFAFCFRLFFCPLFLILLQCFSFCSFFSHLSCMLVQFPSLLIYFSPIFIFAFLHLRCAISSAHARGVGARGLGNCELTCFQRSGS